MANDVTSIRIKLGQLEVDYQGDAQFLKEDLLSMLTSLVELQQSVPNADAATPAGSGHAGGGGGSINFTTGTIARKLKASSGTDLTKAAAAYLALTMKKESFSRDELNAAMKSATGLYKVSFTANLTTQINKLLNDQVLHQVAENTFSLADKARKEIEEALTAE